MEACAREEIAFLESPVQRRSALKGVSIWRTSSCGQCPSGCGTVVRIVDGDARKVEGIRDHPINHGGLCALGQASLQGLYNPDRITAPLRAAGDRGSGKFEEIDWETALGLAAEAMAKGGAADGVRGADGDLALLGGHGGSLLEDLLRRFGRSLGALGPAFLRAPDIEVEQRAAAIALGGTALAYDLENSDYVLSIGPAFLDRWRSPVYGTWALAQMRSGRQGRRAKLVQAESRLSQTAATADEWLAVMPGREGLLARCIAGVLLREERVAGSVAAYTTLFPDPPPDLEAAAALCGLRAQQVQRVARELASVERPVVLGGGSAALQGNGLFNTVAALALNLLLGSVGERGGVFAAAGFGLAPRRTEVEDLDVAALLARLQNQEKGQPIKTLFIQEADPLHTLPTAQGWHVALQSVETIICLSSFMDDTTRQADLILPLQVDVERFNASEPPAALQATLNLSRPAVDARGQCRHPGDVILALATALGRTDGLPWSSFAEMVENRLAESAAELPGGSGRPFRGFFEAALDRGGIWSQQPPAGRLPGPSAAVLPGPAAAFSGSQEPSFSAGDFTLVLFESPKLGDGRGANRPWLQELPDTLSTVMWSSWAEVALPDADDLGVQTGDLLEVESDFGTIEVAAVVTPASRPGTLAIPLGLGHQDFGRYARGRGANPVELLGAETVAGTGAANFGGVRVRVRRLRSTNLAVFGRGLREAEQIPTGWAPQTSRLEKNG